MKRREFFRLGAQKATRAALRLAADKAARRAGSRIRPPFALAEPDFLLACTRCDKCIEACDYHVLFKLPAHHGLQAGGTPAMDLLNRGCHMCQDWPCVQACEPGALALPALDGDAPAPPAPAPLAKLARASIDVNVCLPYLGPECGACRDACPIPGALEWQGGIKPVINEASCTGCGLCREACITDPKAIQISALVAAEPEAAVP
jgi:ferredoxin-type protein NapG